MRKIGKPHSSVKSRASIIRTLSFLWGRAQVEWQGSLPFVFSEVAWQLTGATCIWRRTAVFWSFFCFERFSGIWQLSDRSCRFSHFSVFRAAACTGNCLIATSVWDVWRSSLFGNSRRTSCVITPRRHFGKIGEKCSRSGNGDTRSARILYKKIGYRLDCA